MKKATQFINPFTDFGLKKLFGEAVLAKIFKVADMANLSKEERRAYEQSVKQYRDLKKVTDTASCNKNRS
jgi:hypothetical protein